MKYTSLNINFAICAWIAIGAAHGATAPVVVPVKPSIASKMSTALTTIATDMKTSGREFLVHIPVAIVSSWATNGLMNTYFEYKGYTARVNALLYDVRALHTEVLAALARPITSMQQQNFANRLQTIMDQVPEVSWVYRYLLGLAFHATVSTALNNVVNCFNLDARSACASMFTQKVGDELVDNFAMKSEETWSSVIANLQTEINALYRLIRDLPCCS